MKSQTVQRARWAEEVASELVSACVELSPKDHSRVRAAAKNAASMLRLYAADDGEAMVTVRRTASRRK